MNPHNEEITLKLPPLWLGVLAFILSGFAGLVYEATWTRYLKIILGADAFAQALVLTIFLGGLAIGATLIGKYTKKIQSPLIYYAFIEAVLALIAVYFHDIFTVVYDFLNLGSDHQNLIRWLMSAIIILPQSILLGATFPLLTAAMIREQEAKSGSRISMLYFANSIGGFLGVIAVSFVLVEYLGLPGSMLVGASFSALAAFLAWLVHHRYRLPEITSFAVAEKQTITVKKNLTKVLLIVAFGTGLASFIYEIIWIRMLSLVFGSSSRAFELMLAAFIFGLAFGGLFARFRAQSSKRLITLSFVQILMGTYVVVSIFAYEHLFDLTLRAWKVIPNTHEGFLIYGLFNLATATAYMFIPTFCAGMTLPLVTREVIETEGEKALGMVYAYNTIGSIIGIWLALHILMPTFGLKDGMTIGVAVDLSLGLLIIYYAYNSRFKFSVVAVSMLLAFVLIRAPYDDKLIVSGLYQESRGNAYEGGELLYIKHGKVYTSSVFKTKTGHSISYNGKSDGHIPFKYPQQGKDSSGDLQTTVLLGALPLLYLPTATRAAVIGLGTGKTIATMLESQYIEEIKTIEIEAATIEATKIFPLSRSIYEDPRNEFINTDAKTYFASNNAGIFDIIVSEPSNPWVSGISNLFSKEHFEVMRNKLSEGGLLVQWFPVYDLNEFAIVSILKAINEVFSNYVIYTSLNSDLIVLASDDPKTLVQIDQDNLDKLPQLKDLLQYVEIKNINDIASIYVTDNKFLNPYLESIVHVPTNSDYFPVLENYAIKAWYQSESFRMAQYINTYNFLTSVVEQQERESFQQVTSSSMNTKQKVVHENLTLLNNLAPLEESFERYAKFEIFDKDQIASIFYENCDVSDTIIFNRTSYLVQTLSSADILMNSAEKAYIYERIKNEVPCFAEMLNNDLSSNLLNFYSAYLLDDHQKVVHFGNLLFGNYNNITSQVDLVLFLKYILSEYKLGNHNQVFFLTEKIGKEIDFGTRFAIRAFLAHNIINASPNYQKLN